MQTFFSPKPLRMMRKVRAFCEPCTGPAAARGRARHPPRQHRLNERVRVREQAGTRQLQRIGHIRKSGYGWHRAQFNGAARGAAMHLASQCRVAGVDHRRICLHDLNRTANHRPPRTQRIEG